ncbi:MAG: acyloxyacyl hydrolase [bacterium]
MRTSRSLASLLSIFLVTQYLSALAAQPAPVPTVPMLNLTAGKVGILQNLEADERYGIEYRFRPTKRYGVVPAIGYSRASDGASYTYTDVRKDFWLDDRWVAVPSFGLGYYRKGEELDLGYILEFRSGIELAYRFHGNFRTGIALYHLSNGGISDQNPGTEVLVLSLCLPLSDH